VVGDRRTAGDLKMKKLFVLFVAALIFVGSSSATPPTGKHKPDYALTISTEDETVKSQKGMEVSVSVQEKNISRHAVNAGRPSHPGEWYTMSVMLDGHPGPITELYREILAPKKYDPDVIPTAGGFAYTIKPGESLTFEVPLTAFFDLTAPGKYEITFSRGTDPGRPDNVNVKSNTITITVLPAEAQ
jgi:hypothetical protein